MAGFQCHAIQNRSKWKSNPFIKFTIWEKKEGNYAKTLAKIQVTTIFLFQGMRRSFFPKFIEICVETPKLVPMRMDTNMAAGN